jgi:protocatechuate 3,4-dioxygenase beta subunit
VLAAIAALVFVLFMNDDEEQVPQIVRQTPEVVETPETPRTTPQPVELVESEANRRNGEGLGTPETTTRQAIGVEESASADGSSKVEVKVVDGNGTPIPNALVSLVVKGAAADLAPFLAAAAGNDQSLDLGRNRATDGRTDTDGRCVFERLEPNPFYAIDVSHAEFAPKEVRGIALAAGKVQKVTVTLDLGAMVHGYVRDEAGNGIEGARMVLMPLGALNLDPTLQMELGQVGKTDERGYYAFKNVDLVRTNTVSAHKDGFGRAAQTDLRQEGADRTVEVDFQLVPGLSIRGRVVGPGGQPVEGATIDAYGMVAIQNSRGTTKSKADGSFELADLVEGPYQVRARAGGWSEVREPRVDAGEQNLLLELQPLGQVDGRVVRASNNTPVTDFRVSIRRVTPGTDHYGAPAMPQEFKGRADGSFSMSGVPEGLWVLQVDAEGFASGLSTSIDVRLGQVVTGLEIRISTGGTLTGRVVNQNTGEPIAGARVATQDNGFIDNPLAQLFGSMLARRTTARTAVTDSTGRFALAQLMPGDYQIRIEHNDFTTSIVPNLRVDDSEAPVDFGDFPLREGGAVEGVVYDENGSPLNGATVTLANKEAPGLSYTSRTDEEGRYSIEHVAAGQYVIHAQRAVESTGNPFDVLLDVQNSTREIFVTDAVRQPVDLSLAK